tara:strand:+ start:5056 stop:5196 length:141 start_codon:yes stop_codon:yes gene_type:complete
MEVTGMGTRYETAYDLEKRKAKNNRRLGFVLGVVCTLGAFILWEIL